MGDWSKNFNVKDKNIVGENLRFQRKRKAWTQEQLSEESGVAVRTIQRIENAKVEPQLQTLSLLADALDLDVQELSHASFFSEKKQKAAPEKKWILILHLSPITGFIIPFANLIIPLILWVFKKEDHPLYDEHGRAVVNFHLSVTLAFMVGIALMLIVFELGISLLIITSVYALVLIFWNMQKILKNESYSYPLSLNLL